MRRAYRVSSRSLTINNNNYISTFLFVLSLALASFSSLAQQERPLLTIGVPNQGSAAIDEYMTELEIIYGKLGYNLRSRPAPTRRMVQEANHGSLDGIILMTDAIQEHATNLQRVDVPMTTIEVVVLSKPGQPNITSIEELKGLRVGHLIGYETTAYELRKMDIKPRSTPVYTYQLLLNMVEKNRLDIALILRKEAYRYAAEHPEFNNLKMHPDPLFTSKLYHYIHKRHQHMLPELETIMAKQWSEGRLQSRIRSLTPVSPFQQ